MPDADAMCGPIPGRRRLHDAELEWRPRTKEANYCIFPELGGRPQSCFSDGAPEPEPPGFVSSKMDLVKCIHYFHQTNK